MFLAAITGTHESTEHSDWKESQDCQDDDNIRRTSIEPKSGRNINRAGRSEAGGEK
jgi:hypothetical protein